MIQNYNIEDKESIDYKHGDISAYKEVWEEWDEKKEKWLPKKEFICLLVRNNKTLNLGEMSDGSKFTSVKQAINEAKWLIDYDIEKDLDKLLLNKGFKREDLFKYNSLRIWERIEAKNNLLK